MFFLIALCCISYYFLLDSLIPLTALAFLCTSYVSTDCWHKWLRWPTEIRTASPWLHPDTFATWWSCCIWRKQHWTKCTKLLREGMCYILIPCSLQIFVVTSTAVHHNPIQSAGFCGDVHCFSADMCLIYHSNYSCSPMYWALCLCRFTLQIFVKKLSFVVQ